MLQTVVRCSDIESLAGMFLIVHPGLNNHNHLVFSDEDISKGC